MTGILERIVNFISQSWDKLNPFIIVYPYELVCIFRLGKINRVREQGLYFKWPLIETSSKKKTTVMSLEVGQGVVSKDGLMVEIYTMCRMHLTDIKKYIVTIDEDVWGIVDEIVKSNMLKICLEHDFEELTSNEFYEKVSSLIRDRVQKECKPFGITIDSCRLTHVNLHQIEIFFRRIKEEGFRPLIELIKKGTINEN